MKFASGAKFAVLSFRCVMALALSMGFALSSLLTRAVEGWEWENTAALIRRLVPQYTALASADHADVALRA